MGDARSHIERETLTKVLSAKATHDNNRVCVILGRPETLPRLDWLNRIGLVLDDDLTPVGVQIV